ncbi:MAG: hypothetical protein BWX80_02243 [Candidatus Hydrogenedentes bacterium ADurb.Bin101]|nr:MAG: hypothetical protein BWX80_02243 [Candidatus Hydrogenedentes bacterium ADurb.Bin101]
MVRKVNGIRLSGRGGSAAGHLREIVPPCVVVYIDRGRHAQCGSINTGRADGTCHMGAMVAAPNAVSIHNNGAFSKLPVGDAHIFAVPDAGNQPGTIHIVGDGITHQVCARGDGGIHIMGNMVEGTPLFHLHQLVRYVVRRGAANRPAFRAGQGLGFFLLPL